MWLAGLFVDEQAHGHTPGALARDTPVRAILDHARNALLAPFRHELNILDHGHRLFAQPVLRHRDEPLAGCTENQRGLVAPAMRVAMSEATVCQQGARFAQNIEDQASAFLERHPADERRVGQEVAAAVDGVIHGQAITQADLEVVIAMCRGRVNRASTRIQGDVVAQNHHDLPIQKRVLEMYALQLRSRGRPQDIAVQLHATEGGFAQAVGQNQPAAVIEFDQHIIQFRVERDCLIGRQGPRCGGPDNDRYGHCVTQAEGTMYGSRVNDGKGDVDLIGFLILVFHLGLSERRTTVDAPVHRLFAAMQMAALDDPREGAHDVGLGGEIHGFVRVVPITQHAQTDEVGFLPLDLGVGIGAAGGAEGFGIQLHAGFAVLALDHQFDRQPMAIPTWHIGRIEASQLLGFDDDVLQHLVDGMADVNIAVGIGWAIMQHELGAPGAGRADRVIEVVRLPLRQALRFPLGQVAAHREGGVGQIQG